MIRALATLTPPDLEHPVLETAIAIAIEYAEAAIAQQLLNAVPRQVVTLFVCDLSK